MNATERAAHASADIQTLLGTSLDECALALGRGDVQGAQRLLQVSMEQLRRIRRDLNDK